MASFVYNRLLLLWIFLPYFECSTNPNYILPSVRKEDCQSNGFYEFYDISKLTCRQCAQNSTIQSTSLDGLSCKCNENYKLKKDHGGAEISCEKCPGEKIASLEGWECTECSAPRLKVEEVTCKCKDPDLITADKDLDGNWLTSNTSRQCVQCQVETHPNQNGARCVRCNDILRGESGSCDCPEKRQAGGMCFDRDIEPDYPKLYEMNYESQSGLFSAYFGANLRAAHAACAPNWSNLTACQQVGNLCSLLLYDLKYQPGLSSTRCGTTACNNACSLYLRLIGTYTDNILPSHNTSRSNDGDSLWKTNMPWLFYSTTSSPIADDPLPTVYGREDTLNITLGMYNASGHFLGYEAGTKNSLSLCQTSDDGQIKMGVQLKRECHLNVDRLLNGSTDEGVNFFDPYMECTDPIGRISSLCPIPVLVKDLRNVGNTQINKENNRANWMFVRRFFFLDNLSGREQLGSAPKVVRYMKSMVLHVALPKDIHDGRINVPWLELEYGEVSHLQYGQGQSVKTTFRVVYEMDLSKHNSGIGTAVGVLSGVAVAYSVFQAYNHNRREGKVAIDCLSLLHLLAFLCGTLANAFLVVILGASVWWLLLYKNQQNMFLVPTEAGDYYIKAFLGSAFALKCLDILYLLVTQCTVDMFLLDWERPKKKEETSTEAERQTGQTKVSIWRTYFVANEWNELSTIRRVNMAAQLLLLCLLLQGVGLENLAKFEPTGRVEGDVLGGVETVEYSRVMRFAISALIYTAVAILLWLLSGLNNLILNDRIAAFKDVCTMCNVSVFLMTHEQYGYYIHGRSVHGFADVSLKQMHENIKREEEDLCGTRGLEPGTDHQTYDIALPRRLRAEYNNVLLPVKREKARQRLRTRLDANSNAQLVAYDVLNNFLQKFIEHGLRELDYVITKKNLAERILDTEIEDNRDLGYFYIDEASSFTRILLYGNELNLHMFSLLLFTMVDLIGTNFILAAAVTYFVDEVIRRARYSFGRQNIASKTLVDDRLLI